MAAVTLEFVEDFSIARFSTTIGGEFSGLAGGGASIVACPSGFGWALAKDTSALSDHFTRRTIASPRSGAGFAAFLTLDMPVGDTTWRPIHISIKNGTNQSLRLAYQPSTNQFRLEYNNSISQVVIAGSTVAGPTDPTQAFHVAIEVVRDASAGTAKMWLDGTLVLNLSGVNTGDGSQAFDRCAIYAPTSTGAGQTTIGNVVAWDPAAHAWDGRTKVIQRLAPTADVSSSSWSGASPYWEKLDDPLVSTSTTTGGNIRVALDAMPVQPEEVFGLWVYWRQSGTGSGNSVLHEPLAAYDHTGAASGAFAYMREYIAGPNGGGDWTQADLNSLELSFARISGTVTIPYGHLLVLRTVAEAGPVEADLAVTLADASLAATVDIAPSAVLAVVLDDASLAAAAQVGIGSTGSLDVALDDAALAATVDIDVIGTLAVTLADVSLVSFVVAGSLGPFTRRPTIVIN